MTLVDEATYLRLIRHQSFGPMATVARFGLSAAAIPYGIAVEARNRAFDLGLKKRESVNIPVVSIGNLTLGGTGKTPMVEWAARWLRSKGIRVAILSRGYGESKGMNDEGRVLEENLPDVPHLQGRDRAALAKIAVEELESEAILLDDGFQHRRLARDLDVVLLDALDPFGLGKMFPRGLLREPVSSLKRAGVVVLSRADLIDSRARIAIRNEAERKAGPIRWAEARHAPLNLVDGTGAELGLNVLEGKRVAAFCGIGNPEGFRRTLMGLKVEVAAFRAFPDHHPYSARDVSELAAWAKASGADLALTTQKDSVKLRSNSLGALPLFSLRIGLQFIEGEEVVTQALANLRSP